MKITIYALHDPESGELRYVGKTKNKLRTRILQHKHHALWLKKRNHLHNWLCALDARGLTPVGSVLEQLPADGDWQSAERRWISHYRSLGYKLLNGTDGGEGVSGRVWRPSPEHIEASRQKMLGHVQGEEWLRRKSESLRKHYENPEAYAVRANFCREINARPEVRAKQSEAAKKRWADPEFKQRVSAAMRGKRKRGSRLLHGA